MEKDRNYLINFYNATSVDDGKGEIETYEAWLERQLLFRIKQVENFKDFLKKYDDKNKVEGNNFTIQPELFDMYKENHQEICRKLSWAAYMTHSLLSGIDFGFSEEEKVRLIGQAKEYEGFAAKLFLNK